MLKRVGISEAKMQPNIGSNVENGPQGLEVDV